MRSERRPLRNPDKTMELRKREEQWRYKKMNSRKMLRR